MTPFSSCGKEALLVRLDAMQIEPEGAHRTFVSRLAEENGWPPAYADRVLHEYHRFLYLAVTADHAVTPSDEVDQAWHLHLVYSRHYWGELCPQILGRPLHHGPTAGGRAEAARYRDQYARTLEAYRVTFGTEPPADIWPAARERFAARYQRVDRRRHWILPKLPWRAGLAALLAAGCAVGSDGAGDARMAIFITFSILGLAILGIICYGHWRSRRRDRNGAGAAGVGCGGCGGGLGGRSSKDGDNGCGGDGGGCGGGGCGGGGCGS